MSAIYNFEIEQDSAFHRVMTWKDQDDNPIDLTNGTATLIARVNESDASPVLSLSNGNGLTLGGTAGTITIDISDTDTDALTFNSARYTLKVNGSVLLRGIVDVIRDESE